MTIDPGAMSEDEVLNRNIRDLVHKRLKDTRLHEMELCARDICAWCHHGRPVRIDRFSSRHYWHLAADHSPLHLCQAGLIWVRYDLLTEPLYVISIGPEPVEETCHECIGTGKGKRALNTKCYDCGGTGKVKVIRGQRYQTPKAPKWGEPDGSEIS